MQFGKSPLPRLVATSLTLVLSATAFCALTSPALAKTIYVSPSGNNANSGLTSSAPVRTIQKGYDLAVAGDTIQLSAGDHTERSAPATTGSSDPTLNPTTANSLCFAYPKSGLSKSNPITITGTTSSPWSYVRTGPSNAASAFHIRASGIVLTNLRIVGSQDLLAYDRGLAIAQRRATATADESQILQQCGIVITGVNPQNNNAIPVSGGNLTPLGTKIQYCDISKCSKAAILAFFDADDITIHGNTISNNCRRNLGGSSGINFWKLRSGDTSSTTRIVISRNTVFNNVNELPVSSATLTNFDQKITDGNGLIFDLCGPAYTDYKGRSLVKNNIFFANGGSGICVTSSNNVDIFHNTLYRNVQSIHLQDGQTHDGIGSVGTFASLGLGRGTGCVAKNNIIYGDANAKSFVTTGGTNNTLSNNIFYREGWQYSDLYDEKGTYMGKNQNPQFIAPSMVWGANFKLNIDTSNGGILSPAVNAGASGTGVTTDYDNVSRSTGGAPDAGAYESAYVPPASSGATS